MTNVFEQLKDLHIRNIVVFGKAADHKLYSDAAKTVQITEAELQEMFKKGMLLINLDEDEYAVAVKVDDNKAYTVGTATVGEATVASLVEWTAVAAA